jgi:hypothetical protein
MLYQLVMPYVYHRREGGSDRQLQVVARALPGDFLGTRRLEEDWPGYSWRSALSPGYFRFPVPCRYSSWYRFCFCSLRRKIAQGELIICKLRLLLSQPGGGDVEGSSCDQFLAR